jgi:hypothetical protein
VGQGYNRGEDAIENLARYIIRASFSLERMTHIPEESKVIYESKDGREEEPLEWLADKTSSGRTARDSSNGFNICYKSSVPGIPKKLRFDIHIFNLNRCLLSAGNLQLLRHRVAEVKPPRHFSTIISHSQSTFYYFFGYIISSTN